MTNDANKLKVCNLRCEYMKNPIGLDILKPRLSWVIEAGTFDNMARSVMQEAYRIQVSKEDMSFTNLVWDSGRVGSDQSVHVEYSGKLLESCTRYYYRVKIWDNKGNESAWSETAYWEMGLLCPEEWIAKWISINTADIADTVYNTGAGTHGHESDGSEPTAGYSKLDPCPYMRKRFKLDGKIKKVRVYATALGLYELRINGLKVGDYLFTPGWTSYNKRIQYQTYDVTSLLNEGQNAIGIILGNGWYKGNLAWTKQKNIYGDRLAALVQMHITYEDGREDVIISDESWKYSTGPILMSEIYHGEIYDARLEKEGWDTPDYYDGDWKEVVILDKPKQVLIAQEGPYVKKIEEIKPVNIIETPSGETVIDMGQNMVGWVRFKVKGKAGDKVVLQHGEVLDKNGNFYIENLRSAKQRIEYVLKGNTVETYEPHFTFQGFRYVKLVEYPGKPSIEDFKGIVIHSDMEQTGEFECSNELVNQLQHNILWGQKGNFLDVPTDCPQRDERLGWTGDAEVFIRTACFNMNTALFFKKWLRDLKADQLENGGVPHVIPHVLGPNDHSSSAWGDAATICPWTVYLCFGDKRILEEQYESMKSWVEYIRAQGDDEYLWNTGFHFGDWLGLDAKEGSYTGATSKDYIATAFYAYSISLLVKAAKVLGKEDDVCEYSELHRNVIEAFRKEFITPNGRISAPTQTAHVLALMFNLVEEKDRKRTIDTLVKYLEENKFHLTTGFVGTPYLCHVLSQNGCNDIAYKLVTQTDYPSWLYQVTKGATTIWEHWDGIKEDGSFWSPNMNSFNHYAYGSIGDWLYRVAAGINIDEDRPGYKHIIIKPRPNKEFDYVKSGIKTCYGEVTSEWVRNEGTMEINVCIPHNTTAEVILPGANINNLYENGKHVKSEEIEGILSCEEIDGDIKLELGSGEYRFVW
ncbi:MAG: family 78 glycoside hydrolase catalytic domain [Firmicutes bacterium]|nr:family 78 glycoside hydrolase catalytic domain [Bacillota bacterium]